MASNFGNQQDNTVALEAAVIQYIQSTIGI